MSGPADVRAILVRAQAWIEAHEASVAREAAGSL
jgi:hypothetical protein